MAGRIPLFQWYGNNLLTLMLLQLPPGTQKLQLLEDQKAIPFIFILVSKLISSFASNTHKLSIWTVSTIPISSKQREEFKSTISSATANRFYFSKSRVRPREDSEADLEDAELDMPPSKIPRLDPGEFTTRNFYSQDWCTLSRTDLHIRLSKDAADHVEDAVEQLGEAFSLTPSPSPCPRGKAAVVTAEIVELSDTEFEDSIKNSDDTFTPLFVEATPSPPRTQASHIGKTSDNPGPSALLVSDQRWLRSMSQSTKNSSGITHSTNSSSTEAGPSSSGTGLHNDSPYVTSLPTCLPRFSSPPPLNGYDPYDKNFFGVGSEWHDELMQIKKDRGIKDWSYLVLGGLDVDVRPPLYPR